jgi:hypothetical protein
MDHTDITLLNAPPYNIQLEMGKQMNNVGDLVGRVMYGVTHKRLHLLCSCGSKFCTEYAQSEIPATTGTTVSESSGALLRSGSSISISGTDIPWRTNLFVSFWSVSPEDKIYSLPSRHKLVFCCILQSLGDILLTVFAHLLPSLTSVKEIHCEQTERH